MRIAIADDDPENVAFLSEIVEDMGHISVGFSDGNAVLNALLRDTFDLVILDWMMPGQDGMTLLGKIRDSVESAPPILMMTARSAKQDVADALNAGADDYVTKPEDRQVVAARIAALLRRHSAAANFDPVATYGIYTLDRIAQTVRFQGQEVTLTAKEFDLADLMFRNLDRTLSRAYIMETIWRTNATLTTRTLDMHISRVRSKLELRPENGFRIFTVFGYGYRLESLN